MTIVLAAIVEAAVLWLLWFLYRLDRQAAARREIERLRSLHDSYDPHDPRDYWTALYHKAPAGDRFPGACSGVAESYASFLRDQPPARPIGRTYTFEDMLRMGGTYRSSWDKRWGQVEAYSWLPYADLERLVREAGEIAIAEPRPLLLGMDWFRGMDSPRTSYNGGFQEHARREREIRKGGYAYRIALTDPGETKPPH